LWFVGAQFVASQTVVLDSVKRDSLVLRCIEEPMDSVALVDSVKEKQMQDFISLIEKGEEARRREKNELISLVMASVQKKRNSGEIDTIIESIQLEQQFHSIVNNDSLKFTTWMAALTEQEVFISSDSLLAEIDDSLKSRQSSFATKVNPLFVDWVLGTLPAVSVSFDDADSLIVLLRIRAKSYVRATSPELYTYHRSQLPELSELKINSMSQLQRDKLFLNVDGFNSSKRGMLKIDLPKVSNWTKGAKFQVHASQNYISSNWYKGGESNMAMTMYAIGYFNYDSKKGLQWDNKAEWKLGLYGMASDSFRWLRVNEDLLRLNSKLGYKAFKNFFYTAEWDFQTSLFNTYKSNTYIRTSGPFSPIRMSVSLGVDYKYKSKVSVFLSPLSYKLIYVADMSCKDGVLTTENIAHQIGITDGTCSSNQLGALIRTDFNHDFNESIGMEVHFSFFGNYVGKIKGIEIGCELIGNFKINRFLSAKVSLYPRYDSTTIPTDGGKPKMQFYELISLGFNYKL
jgi:hypothetical protein